MPRLAGRRARANLGPSVAVHTRVGVELHTKVHAAARSMSMSVAEYVALLIERDKVDADGRPLWAPPDGPGQPLPSLDAPPTTAA